jgi:hypothetical protein
MHDGQDGGATGQWEMRMRSGCDSSPLSGRSMHPGYRTHPTSAFFIRAALAFDAEAPDRRASNP